MTEPNILTAAEAAHVLRTIETDPALVELLPLVDDYIENATGHNWAADAQISETAKAAARILVTLWFEDPGMIGNHITALSGGLSSALTQLEAQVMKFTFVGRKGAGACTLIGVNVGEKVAGLISIAGADPLGDAKTSFESVISVADQIQQVDSGDLSGVTHKVRLTPSDDPA